MATRLSIDGEVLDPDVALTETYLYAALVTAHPVEEGVEIVDHVQQRPMTVTLNVLVSETPLNAPVFGVDDIPNRVRAFVDRVRATAPRGEAMTLESARRGTIENLVYTAISEPYTGARGVQITITLRQIRVVASRTVAIPPTLEPRQKKKRDRGKQATETQTPAQVESLASKLSKSAFGF